MKENKIFAKIILVIKMKNNILLNDIIKELDSFILDFEAICTINNMKKRTKKRKNREIKNK